MARYEHLPIYRAAFDLAVHVKTREAWLESTLERPPSYRR
jgi:hypothetical protein